MSVNEWSTLKGSALHSPALHVSKGLTLIGYSNVRTTHTGVGGDPLAQPNTADRAALFKCCTHVGSHPHFEASVCAAQCSREASTSFASRCIRCSLPLLAFTTYARSPLAKRNERTKVVQSEHTSHAYRSCMHRRGSNHEQGLLAHSKLSRVLSAHAFLSSNPLPPSTTVSAGFRSFWFHLPARRIHASTHVFYCSTLTTSFSAGLPSRRFTCPARAYAPRTHLLAPCLPPACQLISGVLVTPAFCLPAFCCMLHALCCNPVRTTDHHRSWVSGTLQLSISYPACTC
jgi:hypothetical protein